MSSGKHVPELEGAVGEGIIGGRAFGEGTGPTLRPPTLTLATAMLNPSTLCSIPVGSYIVATFSSMRIAPNTYLLATTRPRISNPRGGSCLDPNARSSHRKTCSDIRGTSTENM